MNEILNDLKIALAGWYYAMDSEAGNGDDCFEEPLLKNIMKKHNFTKEDVLKSFPPIC